MEKQKLNERKVAVKALVAAVISSLIFFSEMFLPPTYFFAKPMAKLVVTIFSPILPVSAEGTYIISGNHAVDFVDVCTGISYVVLIAMFLWIKNVSAIKMLVITTLVFIANILRIGVVLAILGDGDIRMAALAHDVSYTIFTLIAMGLIFYAVIPILKKY